METIYDHNPTPNELLNLTGGMSKEEYTTNWMYSKEHSLLDITLLYESRNDQETATKYRELIPNLYQQYTLGLDNVAISQ